MPGTRTLVARLARLATHTLAWVALLVTVGVLVAAVGLPRLAGATPYAIETGSMTPSLPPGTLVVVRPARPTDIGVGSVVTYQLRSGLPTVVTHRVVAVALDGSGQPRFQTQGDANAVPDEAWVRPVQLRGTVWYAVPHLGRLATALTGREHRLATYAVAAALAAYAAVLLGADALRTARGWGRRRQVAGVPSA